MKRPPAEKERLQTKAELRDKKRRAIELELAIRAEADRLDARECAVCHLNIHFKRRSFADRGPLHARAHDRLAKKRTRRDESRQPVDRV